MLIGIQKCGTTDLYDKMMIHPNISRARTKEPFWWSRGRFSEYEFTGEEWLNFPAQGFLREENGPGGLLKNLLSRMRLTVVSMST